MFTTYAKNTMLDALTLSHIALHDSYPGDSGTSELSGGTYARVAATINAASSASRALNAAVTLNVPASKTVRWVTAWDALTTGHCMAVCPAGGSPLEFVCDLTGDVVQCPAHGLAENDTIVFYAGTAPGGLTAGVIYYAVTVTTDSFQVALTASGSPVNLTTQAANACLVSKIVPESFNAAGLYQVQTPTTFALTF